MTWGDSAFFVAWEDDRTANVRGARITSAGVVQDPGGFAISSTSGTYLPKVAWDGTNYLVVWVESPRGVYGTRVTPSGAVLAPERFLISATATSESPPAIAFGGTDFLVAWSDTAEAATYQERGYGICGARVTAAAEVRDAMSINISSAANDQRAPAIAWNGLNYLLAWLDVRNSGTTEVFGVRVSPAGVVQDPAAIKISTGEYVWSRPAVASDGSNYLVVWPGDVFRAARVSAGGAVLDGSSFQVAPASGWNPAAAAWSGSTYLVVWEAGGAIYGTRVSPGGSVLDPGGIVVRRQDYGKTKPSVAGGDNGFFVVWQDDQWGVVFGTRVSISGVVLDTTPVPISPPGHSGRAPKVAWGGDAVNGTYLVTWAGNGGAWVARISSAGVVLDPNGISLSPSGGYDYGPAVASDGTDFLVVWEDSRSGSSDIYGARVTTSGTVTEPDGIPFSTAHYDVMDETEPAVASSGPGRFLLAYTGFDASPGVLSRRVLSRTVFFTLPPTASDQSVATPEDTPIAITLSGSDPDGDPLTYVIKTPPEHGTLSGTAAQLTYTPAPNYSGPDAFTFAVNDGKVESPPATVAISIAAVNDPPVAESQSVRTIKETAVAITLSASDVDGDALTYSVVTQPAHATITGIAPNLTCTPEKNFVGSDSFTFVANDGKVNSGVVTVSITVTRR